MLFDIGERVYLNGNITTNRYPRGDMGINEIRTIFANNLQGTIFEIELPNILNSGQFIYTVKIFENLYAIEIKQSQISQIPLPFNTQPNIYNTIYETPNIKLNSLNTLDQLNELNKLNFLNNKIVQINKFNQSINASKQVRKTITKYIYYKLVDEWIYTKLFPILAYVKIVNGVPQLIESMKEYDIDNLASENDQQIEARVKYLEKNIFTKKLVSKVLKKIIKKMCFNWYELDKHMNTIQQVFFEYFKELLEKVIR